MYYPYFRGKQNELLTIRDSADLIAEKSFVPIIEPVKSDLSGLDRSLSALTTAGGKAMVIVNPSYGELKDATSSHMLDWLSKFEELHSITAALLVTESMSTDQVINFLTDSRVSGKSLIHAGFTDGRELSESLVSRSIQCPHVFLEAHCGKLYRRHFAGHRVLVRDGFEKKKNREYKELESFSDLHVTYEDEGMQGFGDFLMVGDEFSDSGGPAYAVAIHLTFIDSQKDDEMFIYHFVSDRRDSPTDPAGKFDEALAKLVAKFESGKSGLDDTQAIQEFIDLHRRSHYPGLGYVKKLSMQHHIQTLANHL